MKVAVADVGTNSSHLLIAERTGRGSGQEGAASFGSYSFHQIFSQKHRTKLGECLDEAGNLTPEGEDRLALALSEFAELAKAAGVAELRVYATSALREAPNGAQVAQRMQQRVGVYPVIISGEREGELTYLGVAHSLELQKDNVLLDLGGGSLELVRGDRNKALDIHSLPLGAIRMTAAYIHSDPTKPRELEDLMIHVRNSLRPLRERFKVKTGTLVALSSGTAETAAKLLCLKNTDNMNGFGFRVSELGALLEQIAAMSVAERAKNPLLERRADIIVAGLAVLYAALIELGAQEVVVSNWALREGMMIEEISKYTAYSATLSTRQQSVLALADHFGADLAHATQVAELARHLYDELEQAGMHFPEYARSVLTAAATLHDIGIIVSRTGHHKHSAYLIRHTDFPVYTAHERELIALIARYHRKSLPKPSHADYMMLPPEERRLVSGLAAVLRVADGLDRSHSGVTKAGRLQREGQGWVAYMQQVTPLDIGGAMAKADLWQREFGGLSIRSEQNIPI